MVAFPASVSSRSCPGHCVHIQSNIDTVPSKYAGSHPEAFWLRPLRPSCSQNRAGSYMPDPTSRFLFSSVFSKEGMDHTVQNRPGSDLDGLVRVWLNSSGLKTSRCAGIIGPGFWQDATGLLLVSHFQARLPSSTDVPDNIIQNQP